MYRGRRKPYQAIFPVVPALVISVLLLGCLRGTQAGPDTGGVSQEGQGPGTQPGVGTREALGRMSAIKIEALTGFSFEVAGQGPVLTHAGEPELTRYVANLVVEGCTALGEPPDLENCSLAEYRLTFHSEADSIGLRIVDRNWPPEVRAHFLQDGAQWYRLRADVLTTVYEIAATPEATMALKAKHLEFLAGYGWKVWYQLNSYTYRLPASFLYRTGDFPTALFWAHRSELSAKVGLDLDSLAGEEVVITIYRLDRDIPELGPRGGLPRAIIVNAEDQIVGAWVDKGRHGGEAMTLEGEKVPPSEEFLSQFVDTDSPLETELGKMEPEDVIRAYWAAVDTGDYARAHGCETRTALFRYLFANMDNARHANESFVEAFADGLENYVSVKVMGIEPYSLPGDDDPETVRHYRVLVNQDVKTVVTTNDGRMIWFTSLVKTPTGWRVEGYGTGP